MLSSTACVSSVVLNLDDQQFWLAVFVTALIPTLWNIIARNEYERKSLTKLVSALGFNKHANRVACYLLALAIFLASDYRTVL
jgi:hypothetical protein